MSHAAMALIIVGGAMQVLGVVLTAVQIYRVRKRYLARFGSDSQTTYKDLTAIKEPIADLASGGWKWGIASVSLIVAGIVCTTVGSVIQ